jgi:hypothetical protein
LNWLYARSGNLLSLKMVEEEEEGKEEERGHHEGPVILRTFRLASFLSFKSSFSSGEIMAKSVPETKRRKFSG